MYGQLVYKSIYGGLKKKEMQYKNGIDSWETVSSNPNHPWPGAKGAKLAGVGGWRGLVPLLITATMAGICEYVEEGRQCLPRSLLHCLVLQPEQ